MTIALTKLPPLMDVADFIEWPGDGLGTRFELVDGIVRAMAPASDAHGTILVNLGRLIGNHLVKARPSCRVVATPGVQPRVRAEWNYRIPDLGVTCSPNRPGDLFTPDPILLIEVLSPSNVAETYEAVRAYATLPSVQEILVVHSTRIEIELLRRDKDGNWPANPTVIRAGASLPLQCINAELALPDIYANTHLS
jgi:Uma2 family endonuclease